jgi:pimeloyl-ACP methyl ester carboxylesterase
MKWSVPVPAIAPWTGEIRITANDAIIEGSLEIPEAARGLVLFAHGSGSSRLSPRNRRVAAQLRQFRLATLLFDLLTADEEAADNLTRRLRFDISFLASRLLAATRWAASDRRTAALRVGYFGSSTGAGAALMAAADEHNSVEIAAIVSRGGRPDLADGALARVRAPTLLIVGGDDTEVISLNEKALAQLPSKKRLEIIPGATHLFEEPGKLEIVAGLAANWFTEHFSRQPD